MTFDWLTKNTFTVLHQSGIEREKERERERERKRKQKQEKEKKQRSDVNSQLLFHNSVYLL